MNLLGPPLVSVPDDTELTDLHEIFQAIPLWKLNPHSASQRSHSLALGRLSDAEEGFLVSLFFSPEERDCLAREDGRSSPVTHFRLA